MTPATLVLPPRGALHIRFEDEGHGVHHVRVHRCPARGGERRANASSLVLGNVVGALAEEWNHPLRPVDGRVLVVLAEEAEAPQVLVSERSE